MQKPNILPRHHMNQLTRLNMPDLNETRLKGQDVRIVERETLRRAFPLDLPVGSCSPAIAIHKEAEIRVIEQELPVQTFYMDGLYALLSRDEVERGVSLVEQRLAFSGFQGHNLEAASAANAECTTQVVYGGGFGGDVEFLDCQ